MLNAARGVEGGLPLDDSAPPPSPLDNPHIEGLPTSSTSTTTSSHRNKLPDPREFTGDKVTLEAGGVVQSCIYCLSMKSIV